MNTEELTIRIRGIANSNNVDTFKTAEEYYFALGEVLSAVFIEIGGFDRYRREFNYLTNPYLPSSIQKLCIRILNFLDNVPSIIRFEDKGFEYIKELLFTTERTYTSEGINKITCEDAFYSGLYSDNIFIKQ